MIIYELTLGSFELSIDLCEMLLVTFQVLDDICDSFRLVFQVDSGEFDNRFLRADMVHTVCKSVLGSFNLSLDFCKLVLVSINLVSIDICKLIVASLQLSVDFCEMIWSNFKILVLNCQLTCINCE